MIKKIIKFTVSKLGYKIKAKHPFEDLGAKLYSKYCKFTMIPHDLYVDNIELVSGFSNVDGCIVECGVWRGGMSAGMAEVFSNRRVYLFDSFEGLPDAKEIDGEAALKWQKNINGPNYHDNCTAEIKEAEEAMLLSGAEFELVKGWFKVTLPNYKFEEKIAILRLDADWYDSTMECLDNLFPKVIRGGVIIFDDYYTWDGCSRALHDFLSKTKSTSRIHKTAKGLSYIIKQD
ncbi:TylF/MycF/NovP-related O-methyltransferase [Marivirga harenae]|uniref:TylF/MycF/NovP-related O-methyltransferase n=1 Tax=Marivirga harenae TaxID=2010992 RepID=UPI0026DEE87D|nr:TylF/MycF/NovP-related O-methyltransferase [Marivirga harenae]WKV13424.1 TylF/MycF/NovP-related O-methyltransferase [Marivirga harenae]